MRNLRKIQKYLFYLFCFCAPWTITGSQFSLILGLLSLVILTFFFKRELNPSAIDIFLFLFIISHVISALLSEHPQASFSTLQDYWILLAFLWFANLLIKQENFHNAINILGIASVLVGIYAIFQHFTGITLYSDIALQSKETGYVAMGFFSHHLTFGGVFLVSFLLALSRLLYNPGKGKYLILSISWFLFSGAGLLFSYARSCWIGAVAGFVAIVAFKESKYRSWILLTFIVLIVLAILFLPGIQKRVSSIFNFSFKSNKARLTLWKTSWEMFTHNPIIGIGPGLFESCFQEYYTGGYYETKCHPHNDYLNVLVETGLIGLLIFLGLFFAFFYEVFKVRKRHSLDQETNAFTIGSIGVIIGIMVASLFQCFFTDAEVGQLVILMWGSIVYFQNKLISGEENEGKCADTDL